MFSLFYAIYFACAVIFAKEREWYKSHLFFTDENYPKLMAGISSENGAKAFNYTKARGTC